MISAAIVAVAAYFLGFYMRDLRDQIKTVEQKISSLKKPPVKEKPKSRVFDPNDVVQRAKYEHEENMRKLNPHLYKDE